MIATYQALIVTVLALLPGASYTFALERTIGSYGINFSDRLVRFLAASAIFHALASGPEYLLYRRYLAGNLLAHGDLRWWVLELLALPYVFVPIGVGFLAGRLRKRWLGRVLVGVNVEPKAWDYLWGEEPEAIVRLKLKSDGTWLAGLFATRPDGRRSYTSAYPADDSDLYLVWALETDSASGALIRDDEGRPKRLEGEPGLLVRWAEIEYLEIEEFASEQSEAAEPQQGSDDR